MTRRAVAAAVLLMALADASLFGNERSLEEIRQRLAQLPAEGAHGRKADLHSELGTNLYRDGLWVGAVQAFEEGLHHHPSGRLRRHIYLYLGKSYESLGVMDKAIQAYEEALIYDQRNWRRHRDLGGLYENAGLLRKALACYESALRLNKKEPLLYLSMGRVYRKMGLFQNAGFFLTENGIAGAPADVLNRELSLVYEGQGRFADAAAAWQKQLNPPCSAEDAARLVYLAHLAGHPILTASGLKLLEASGATTETMEYYKKMVALR